MPVNKKQISSENRREPFNNNFKPPENAGAENHQPSQKYAPREKILYISLAALAVMVVVLAVWGIKQFNEANNARRQLEAMHVSSAVLGQSDDQQLIDQVGNLIVLPQDEQPTIATVDDLSKLEGQPFFAQAQVGDKVLIYTKAQKAILYRPSTNKIIELAPLTASPDASASSTPSSQSQALTVEIRNGSGKSGAAADFKAKLEADGEFTVTEVGNAQAAYPQTELYVIGAEQGSSAAAELQQLASATMVSVLPSGEPSSSAQAVLILGKQ